MTTPATNKQVPDHAILDHFNKQAYLGNQYVANTGEVALTGTTEVPFLYISNPLSTSTSIQNQLGIFLNTLNLTCHDVTGATDIVFRIYKNPTTVAAGSAITPRNARFASTNTSGATVKKSPTAVANGTLIETLLAGFAKSEVMYIVDPGQSLLITAQPSADTVGIAVASWYEI